jgi:hypothetical protein
MAKVRLKIWQASFNLPLNPARSNILHRSFSMVSRLRGRPPRPIHNSWARFARYFWYRREAR